MVFAVLLLVFWCARQVGRDVGSLCIQSGWVCGHGREDHLSRGPATFSVVDVLSLASGSFDHERWPEAPPRAPSSAEDPESTGGVARFRFLIAAGAFSGPERVPVLSELLSRVFTGVFEGARRRYGK